MAERLQITTQYVMPSGISQRQVADGFITARVCLGHITAPSGVMAELNGTMEGSEHFGGDSQPVPWIDRKTRNQAADEAARMPGLKDDLREQLAAHIRKSAYFEDPQ